MEPGFHRKVYEEVIDSLNDIGQLVDDLYSTQDREERALLARHTCRKLAYVRANVWTIQPEGKVNDV